MKVTVGLHAEFTVYGVEPDGSHSVPTAEGLEQECDKLMEALLELEASGCGISDSAVSADFSRAIVEISLVAIGENYDDAEERAAACMRTAIHKGGGHTPDWNPSFTATSKRSELIAA